MWTHLSASVGWRNHYAPRRTTQLRPTGASSDKISRLKQELKDIDKQNGAAQNRGKLVRGTGRLYKRWKVDTHDTAQQSDVFAENKLFATLDTQCERENREPAILPTDTVGFIRKLPTHLIESFKSTLMRCGGRYPPVCGRYLPPALRANRGC